MKPDEKVLVMANGSKITFVPAPDGEEEPIVGCGGVYYVEFIPDEEGDK